MQGLILAAGMGKRLKELTRNNTKCMVKVNGVTLIERMLHQLDQFHLSRVVIVIGYEGKKLQDYIASLEVRTPICYVENPIYDKTNNIYSLALAKDYLLQEDTLLLESDLIFEDSVLKTLLEDPRETLALVDKYESWMDGTVIKIDEDDHIQEFVPGKKFVFADIPYYFKTVNIYKFSKHFSETHYVPFLIAYSRALGNNEYYEQVLRVITMLDEPEIKAKRLNGQLWYEIDDIQDLDIASSMFTTQEDRVEKISARYGGYWRYPKLIDFCYLVNPYFPPRKLLDEMKANFEEILTQYPSGMRVNSLLAAKNFGVHPEHIVVGNGAAELIKYIMEGLSGSVGFIQPTFEEYVHRGKGIERICFRPSNGDFSYTAEDVMAYFSEKKPETLVLVNPDNPSGNYIPKSGLLRLLDWSEKESVRLIIDESFVDFADETGATLISEEYLTRYSHVVIVKSISKSYGVPGLRLGIAASGDEELIAGIKKEAAIWNINSFGEFYMQIAEKYEKDYENALIQLRKVRTELAEGLSSLPGIRVIPSQANYLMVELTNGMTAKAITRKLLLDANLFVKDLSAKIREGEYLRIAVRSSEENQKLIGALRLVLAE